MRKEKYLTGTSEDVSLTSTGYFRLANVANITTFLNSVADEDYGARLIDIKASSAVLSSGIGSSYGFILIKVPKTATITETQSTSNLGLQDSIESKVNDELSYAIRLPKNPGVPEQVIYDSTSTTFFNLYKLSGSWKASKNLLKVGEGGISDEHKGDESTNMMLMLCMFHYVCPPPAAGVTALARVVYQIQYSKYPRKVISRNL